VSVTEKVKTAPTPRAALLVLAEAIDKLEARLDAQQAADPWDDTAWSTEDDGFVNSGPVMEADISEDGSGEVNFKVASEEKQADREKFAREVLKLDQYYHNEASDIPGEDLIHAYKVAGPMWLYVSDRDCVMSYDENVRRHMAEDVLEDDPVAAFDFAKDVLKDASSEGPDEYRSRRGELGMNEWQNG
jgi:hypothetical protein